MKKKIFKTLALASLLFPVSCTIVREYYPAYTVMTPYGPQTVYDYTMVDIDGQDYKNRKAENLKQQEALLRAAAKTDCVNCNCK